MHLHTLFTHKSTGQIKLRPLKYKTHHSVIDIYQSRVNVLQCVDNHPHTCVQGPHCGDWTSSSLRITAAANTQQHEFVKRHIQVLLLSRGLPQKDITSCRVLLLPGRLTYAKVMSTSACIHSKSEVLSQVHSCSCHPPPTHPTTERLPGQVQHCQEYSKVDATVGHRAGYQYLWVEA